MEIINDIEEKKTTLKELSVLFNLPVSTLRKRCIKKQIKPIRNVGYYKYLLTQLEVDKITQKELHQFNFGEIIYVHTTWLILESKMNRK